MEEIELKFLDIEPKALEEKLKAIGATRVKEFIYQLRAFDFPGLPLANEKHAWVRLRDDGTETTLSYKQRLGVTSNDASVKDEGMEEIEVRVSDFERTTLILSRIGMIQKAHQEKKRIRYVKGEIEYDIDIWPLIPPYLEIEGPSLQAVEEAARELGYDPEEAKVCSASQIFKHYGINYLSYSVLTFDTQEKRDVPLEGDKE